MKLRIGKGPLVLAGVLLCLAPATAGASSSDWAAPTSIAIRRVGDALSVQHRYVAFPNLPCATITYRLVNDDAMNQGCFTPTALGLFNADQTLVIFNGTDEALPLKPLNAGQTLVPWPAAGVIVSLQPLSTGGAYVSLYRNGLGAVRDERDGLGQLRAKRLVTPPDLQLRYSTGQPLVVNPLTLAFSEGGSWLVAENLNGSFVRVNLTSLDVSAFAPAYSLNNSLPAQVAVSRDGHYVAVASDFAPDLKVYDLAGCLTGTSGSRPPDCSSYNYYAFVRQRIDSLQAIRDLNFINDGLISFTAYTGGSSAEGVYELAPAESIDYLVSYLGLGDSYTSGEGAFDYLAGTDTADNHCHLSVRSYPLLLARDLFGSGGHSVACSGAIIDDVAAVSDSYPGQSGSRAAEDKVLAEYLPGYLAQQRFVAYYQPRITTVSIGGNDIGFGDILRRCVMPRISLKAGGNTCFNTYEDRRELLDLIDRTVPRWMALYRQLQATAPATKLYAIGYPAIFDATGSCGLNVLMNHDELEFASLLTTYLNNAIATAAQRAGVDYIDISEALYGHRLCESREPAVNGLTSGDDAGALGIGLFGRESYHPNALGHELIEQTILRQTHDLTAADTPPGAADVAESLLKAPRTGRPTRVLVPDDSVTSGVSRPGESLEIMAKGPRDGLLPETTYQISLDAGQRILSNLTTDEVGNLAGTVTLPTELLPGSYTLDIMGPNQTGHNLDIVRPLYVYDPTIYDPARLESSTSSSLTHNEPFTNNAAYSEQADSRLQARLLAAGHVHADSHPRPDLDQTSPWPIIAVLAGGLIIVYLTWHGREHKKWGYGAEKF